MSTAMTTAKREREKKHVRITMIPLFCTEIDMKSIKIYSWSNEKLCVLNSFDRFFCCFSISFWLSIRFVSFKLISLLLLFSFTPMWHDEKYARIIFKQSYIVKAFVLVLRRCHVYVSRFALCLVFCFCYCFSRSISFLVSFISAFGRILWLLL